MSNPWVKAGWGYAPRSVDELFRLIARINSLQTGTHFVWRGVHNSSWSVESSLQRALRTNSDYYEATAGSLDVDPLRAPERRILESARAWGVGLFPSGFVSDLQLLAVLQHHGAPTRLIDVTPDPMTALWFACQDELAPHRAGTQGHAGVLFAFNVTDMQTVRSIDPPRGNFSVWHDSLASGLEQYLTVSRDSRSALLLKPASPDARMSAQQGQFLFGAAGVSGIPEVPAFPSSFGKPTGTEALAALSAAGDRKQGRPRRVAFAAIVISPRLKRGALRSLGGYNKSAKVLFPDLGGFVEAMSKSSPDALLKEGSFYNPALENRAT